MAYQRKTVDEWQLLGDYGYGFERLLSEDTRKEVFIQLKTYRENERKGTFKIVRKRVKIVPTGESK